MKIRLLHTALIAAAIALATSCTNDTPTANTGDMIRVDFTLPGSYAIPGTGGKANGKSRAETHPDLKPEMLQQLEDGSTLWLAIYDVEKPEEEPILKSYVVRRTANGYSTLYTCKVDDEGNVKPNENEAPLFLPVDKTYRFRAISPAKKLLEGEKLAIDNGDYLLATDDRFTQTESKEIKIDGNNTGITVVELNPLLQQTARMQFSIEAEGDFVHSLDILPAGIEVSGIQDAVLHDNEYNWATSKPLNMYLGSKHSSITIKEFTKDEHGCITGEAAVLPTDAVSNSIVVLLNLSVNKINSQYTMMLNAMQLEAAHSYNFKIKIKVEDDITVAVWQSQSWETDMILKTSPINRKEK